MRVFHRFHVFVTLSVALILLVLKLAGILSAEHALWLFLAIELPLLVAFIFVTAMRFMKLANTKHDIELGLLDRIVIEEPLLRPAVYELKTFRSLFWLIRGRLAVPDGAREFGYVRGTLAIPIAFAIASIIELAIVHLIIPWFWLQMTLLIITVWGMLFLCGIFATRAVYPHYLFDGELYLRFGFQIVAKIPIRSVKNVLERTSFKYTQPEIDDDSLVLTQFQNPNLVLETTDLVSATPPLSKKKIPENFRTKRFLIYVSDPERFVTELSQR